MTRDRTAVLVVAAAVAALICAAWMMFGPVVPVVEVCTSPTGIRVEDGVCDDGWGYTRRYHDPGDWVPAIGEQDTTGSTVRPGRARVMHAPAWRSDPPARDRSGVRGKGVGRGTVPVTRPKVRGTQGGTVRRP